MKFLTDFLPIVLFFIAFKFFDIYTATAVAIAASAFLMIVSYIQTKKVETMALISFLLISVLGGATIALKNEAFIQWKPTAINWALALVFLFSQWFTKKTLIQRMMEANITLAQPIWKKINIQWVSFFLLTGVLNLIVVYNFDLGTWVNFKLFGLLGLTFVFVIIQSAVINRYASKNTDSAL